MRQKARLPAALASLNNGHSFDLCTCCVGVKSSSKPNLVFAMPLCPHSTAWRYLFVTNLSNTTSWCTLTVEAEVLAITGRYCMVVITLARNFIWPYNSFVLSRCTSSFLISPSLASKPVKWRLNLCSSCLGMSTRFSTTWLTNWHTFLAITVVHLGSSIDTTLVITTTTALRSINWLIARLLAAVRNAMFSMAASILNSRASIGELSVLRPVTS